MASMTNDDDESVVRLEVDASSLKPVFDNIQEGFNNYSKAIRSNRLGLYLAGFGALTANIGVVILSILR